MAELFTKDDKRTHYCGKLSSENIGLEVCVCGWVQRVRDLGGLIFADLRDREGIVQLSFDENTPKQIFDKAFTLRSEFVLSVKGIVRARAEGAVNKKIQTGDVEIWVKDFKILSAAQTTPFEITDSANVHDETLLKYRYLDLRRSHLQKNMKMRHEIAKQAREYFYENGFYEIETPMLMKPTPEGARDYLVPSRIQNGKFYALPQSPQIYKQLLMLSGFDRYIQLARCFRDEDLRADRQPEFTQIDLEMSFADEEDIMTVVEGFIARLFDKVLNEKVTLPIRRMTYNEAMNRYGSDKPDTRFGMEICDISSIVADCSFSVFTSAVENGGSVRGVVAKGAAKTLSRKEIDKLTEVVKGIGAKGMAYIRFVDDTPNCSFAKFITADKLDEIMTTLGCEKGDCAFIIADKNKVTLPTLGYLRTYLAKLLKYELIGHNFLWITEFPFFEWDDESESWVAMHHPFTMVLDECLEYLDTNPELVRAKAYDLVLNGTELLSGSIRITDYELQQRMFKLLGLTEEEINAKFGFLVDAYKYGAPPHGGAGIGLDRLTMIMCQADSLRDVIAFPKVQNASEPMSSCPSYPDRKALTELGIEVKNIAKDE